MRGDSGFIHLDGDSIDPGHPTIQDMNDRAVADFPACLVEGHLVHIYEQGGEWHVWLNTEVTAFDGLCIGIGRTRNEAVAQAVRALEAVAAFLQGPPQ